MGGETPPLIEVSLYEIFLCGGAIKSSIGSGGRYDNAIGGLIGDDTNLATVGISFGLDVIYTTFLLDGKVEPEATVDIYIIPISVVKEALRLAQALRKGYQRVEVELSGKKVRKAMEKANRENIRKVIILGEEEIEAGEYGVKDMATGRVEKYWFAF